MTIPRRRPLWQKQQCKVLRLRHRQPPCPARLCRPHLPKLPQSIASLSLARPPPCWRGPGMMPILSVRAAAGGQRPVMQPSLAAACPIITCPAQRSKARTCSTRRCLSWKPREPERGCLIQRGGSSRSGQHLRYGSDHLLQSSNCALHGDVPWPSAVSC